MLLFYEWLIFQTEKGSIYKFDNSKSIRYKTPHDYHDDTGLKEISELTVFINPQLAREIGMWQTSSARQKRIVLYNNKIILLSWMESRNQHGQDRTYADNSYYLEPQIGLSPLELWNKSSTPYTWLKPGMLVFAGNHPGNKINKIGNLQFPV